LNCKAIGRKSKIQDIVRPRLAQIVDLIAISTLDLFQKALQALLSCGLPQLVGEIHFQSGHFRPFCTNGSEPPPVFWGAIAASRRFVNWPPMARVWWRAWLEPAAI